MSICSFTFGVILISVLFCGFIYGLSMYIIKKQQKLIQDTLTFAKNLLHDLEVLNSENKELKTECQKLKGDNEDAS